MSNLTKRTPVEIDTELANLDGEYNKLMGQRSARISFLHSLDGQRAVYRTRNRKEWPVSDEETIASVRAKLAKNTLMHHDKEQAEIALARLGEAEAQAEANRDACKPFDAEYARRPWQRFFQVDGGHIHSDMWCKGGSIRWDTRRGWRPELANADVDQAIKELGSHLCTKCFPNAPVAGKVADPNACPGKSYVEGTFRNRYPSGVAECSVCHTMQTVTSTGMVRKHKAPKN